VSSLDCAQDDTHPFQNNALYFKRETSKKITHPKSDIRNQKSHISNRTVMYAIKNKVQLIGYLGAAPEIRNFDNDRKMARFSLATSEAYENAKGEKVTETTWHNIVAWGKLAEIAGKYLTKGSEVAIEGKLVSRSYTDKEGVKRYITEVEVREMLMLGERKKEAVA
jgi:single-strand DNA-binding protein